MSLLDANDDNGDDLIPSSVMAITEQDDDSDDDHDHADDVCCQTHLPHQS